MRSYILRFRAKRDLESAVIYIGEVLGSPEAAKRFVESFSTIMGLVCNTPSMGAPFEDKSLANKGYRRVLVDKYRVFYTFDDEIVCVWRIIHCNQDIDDFALIDYQ